MAQEPQDGHEALQLRDAEATLLSLDDEGSDTNTKEGFMALLRARTRPRAGRDTPEITSNSPPGAGNIPAPIIFPQQGNPPPQANHPRS